MTKLSSKSPTILWSSYWNHSSQLIFCPGGRILPSTAARLWRKQSWDSQNMAGKCQHARTKHKSPINDFIWHGNTWFPHQDLETWAWEFQSWQSKYFGRNKLPPIAGLGGGHPVVPGALLRGATTTTATTSKGCRMLWWEKKETQSWFLTSSEAEKTEKSCEKKVWAATQTRRPSSTWIEKANWISYLCTETPDEL